ncbi:MAG: hypothetical protein EVJ46_08585 [Candidatus Acididesulfobacter guangdongensis]|uniref:Uncharacterized protein n=1 Tax=Acididesulfobacter guangdongensis TaxID=2597225 RepID=A0A519BE83_ACIG2|nr:MAG: hypothetical protein EVJ46_08585 [Candidatus Acididesulfobacter guangdongensis]
MLKKSLLSLAVVLFLSSLFIPGAFAFTRRNCMPNGKLNVNCANLMNFSQLEKLKVELYQKQKNNPTLQNKKNLTEIRLIISKKFPKYYNKEHY